MSLDNSTSPDSAIFANVTFSNDTTDANATTSSPGSWFAPVSQEFQYIVNGTSLAFAVLSILLFALARYRDPKLFSRVSLRLILTIQATNAAYHGAYIYTIWKTDDKNCEASVCMFIFSGLMATFLTTALAVNLVWIAVLKRTVQTNMYAISLGIAGVLAAAFALPPVFMDVIGFNPIFGCWFVGPHLRQWLWVFYYGPFLTIACLNLLFAVMIRSALSPYFGKWFGRSNTSLNASTVSESNDYELSVSKTPRQPNMRSQGDAVRAVAIKVNYYVVIPFICAVGACFTDSTGNYADVPQLIQTFLASLNGTLTFILLCFDGAVRKAVLRVVTWEDM